MTAKNVTNKSKGSLGLPNGQLIDSGTTVLVKNWEKVESNEVVKGWVDAGALTLTDAAEQDDNTDNGGNPALLDNGTGNGDNTNTTVFVAKTDAELEAFNNGERANYIEKELGGQVKSGATKDDLTKQIKELEAVKLAANPAPAV